MSTTTMSQPSSIPLFAQLIQRLHYTNARYNQIAHQCRRAQHPTHHAKRRAYRAGLRIDMSKARVAWPSRTVSAASVQLLPVSDRTTSSPAWVATETETEIVAEENDSDLSAEDARTPRLGLVLRHLSPGVVMQMHPVTLCDLSPLELGLGLGSSMNVDDSDACDLPFSNPVLVPRAPRWRSIPLPEDDCGMEAMPCATPVSTEIDVAYTGLGITVPPPHLKRKLRDVEVDRRAS